MIFSRCSFTNSVYALLAPTTPEAKRGFFSGCGWLLNVPTAGEADADGEGEAFAAAADRFFSFGAVRGVVLTMALLAIDEQEEKRPAKR